MTSLDKPRSRRLRPSARRAEILDAAAELFRHRDPSSVGLAEVAEAAGVSRSLVYTYFGDRAGLVAAVYLHTLTDFDRQLSDMLDAVPIDAARFRAIVARYLCLVGDNAHSWRLFAAAGALDHPSVREARRARTQRIADTWGGGGEARLLARGIVGLLEAAAAQWVEYRECELDDAIDLLSRMLWDGISRIPVSGPAA